MASLLDIDITLSSGNSQLGQMPPPLLPQATLPPPLFTPLDQEKNDPTKGKVAADRVHTEAFI